MRAEVRVVFRDDLFEERDRFERVGARLLAGRFEAVVDREAEHRLRIEIVRVSGHELAQARDVGRVCSLFVAWRAARGLCFDVQTLARRDGVAERHRFGNRFTRADLRIDGRAVGRARHSVRARLRCPAARAAARRVAQQLERGTIVARRTERDAPVRHRHVRVVLQRLEARPLRFLEPERVNLRHALQHELAGVFRLRREREVLRRAHARQQLGRQQRLRARRHDAQVRLLGCRGLFGLGLSVRRRGRCEQHEEGGGGEVFHEAKYSRRAGPGAKEKGPEPKVTFSPEPSLSGLRLLT